MTAGDTFAASQLPPGLSSVTLQPSDVYQDAMAVKLMVDITGMRARASCTMTVTAVCFRFVQEPCKCSHTLRESVVGSAIIRLSFSLCKLLVTPALTGSFNSFHMHQKFALFYCKMPEIFLENQPFKHKTLKKK